ncbi:mCG144684, partial [Mus musculus]
VKCGFMQKPLVLSRFCSNYCSNSEKLKQKPPVMASGTFLLYLIRDNLSVRGKGFRSKGKDCRPMKTHPAVHETWD